MDRVQEKIPIDDLYAETEAAPLDFPKYTTQLLNLANQNAQGTRPRVVGQVSELVGESGAQSFEEWKEWYLERYPDAIEEGNSKVKQHVANLRDAIEKIDEEMIRDWVEDLILVKTAEGLLIQWTILQHLAENFAHTVEHASPEEESRGIDGHVGTVPVSVKPVSYKTKPSTEHEEIDAVMVYYKTTDKYLTVQYNPGDFGEPAD